MAIPTISHQVSTNYLSPGGTSSGGALTIGAGTKAVVAVIASSATDPISVGGHAKVNGVNMTLAGDAGGHAIFYLLDPLGSGVPAGSRACTVDFSSGAFRAASTFYALDHADPLEFRDFDSASGDGYPGPIAVPTLSGSISNAIGLGSCYNEGFFVGAPDLGPDLVEDWYHNIASVRLKTFHDITTPDTAHASNHSDHGTLSIVLAMFGPVSMPSDITFSPDSFGAEAGFQSGIFFGPSIDVLLLPRAFGTEVGFQSGIALAASGPRQVMLTGNGIETPEMTENGTEGQVLTFHEASPPTWEDATGGGGGPTDWAEDTDITNAAFGDVRAANAGTEHAPAGHRHGMPANPVTAHEAASDPHPGYLTPTEGDAAYAALAHSHTGLPLDFGEVGDISASALGDTALAGATGEIADAGHRHAREANPMTAQDDIIIGGASGAPTGLAKGTDGQVLTVDPVTHHLVWKTPAGLTNPMTTIGDMIYSSDNSGTPTRLARGTDRGARLTIASSIPAWMTDANGDDRSGAPSAYDEEFDATTLAAWTSFRNSGTVTNQRLSDMMESPAAPSWNANTDIPGALVLQPLAAGRLGFYRAFPYPAGDVWIVAAKMRLHNAFSANDTIALVLANETTPLTTGKTPTNGVGINLRTSSTTALAMGAYSAGVTAAVAAAELAAASTVMYACFTGRANGDILAWVSDDGVSWMNVGRFNGALCIPNIIYVIAVDNNLDAAVVGIVDWIRFGFGHNNPWLLMNGLTPAVMHRSLRPTGDGFKSGGAVTYSTGTTGWNLLDDPSVDSADYVQYRNASAEALFTFPSTGISSGTITKVRFWWAGTMVASTSNASQVYRTGGVDYLLGGGGTLVQGTSSPVSVDANTNPAGGAWTWAQVNAIEYGIRANASGPYNNQTNALWVEVWYTP